MRQFLKFTLASILGTIVSTFLLFFILIVVVGGAISSALGEFNTSDSPVNVKDNTILHIELDKPIADRGPEKQFDFNFGPFASSSVLGLDQILEALKDAKTDENIAGIFLDISGVGGGMATTEEIRNALIDFKTSGKWIVSYSEMYSQKAYYLASVSDEIYVYPEGVIDFRGLSTNIAFLKGMFEKLEIEMQIIRGSNNKFKSAVEPFMLDEMSQANRAQTEQWMGSIWNNMLSQIGKSRNLSAAQLQEIADTYRVQDGKDAVAAGLATDVKHFDEVLSILKTKTETEEKDDLETISLTKYIRAPKSSGGDDFEFDFDKAKIAVVYASGGIGGGDGTEDEIGSDAFARAIREARRDSSIKAIVLRVNSPGGSALASDVIWRETVLAKAAKPLVVSMGDVAASGGYYIAAAADHIMAMPNTITGSIGVFGVIPNVKGLFNNKFGITFDGVKTGKYADFPNVTRPLTDMEYAFIQNSVDSTYATFVSRVGQGRDMSAAKVDSIGQGRVWSGIDAIPIGLVDSYGGLNDAIAKAAELANVKDYKLKAYPEMKDPFEQLMEDFSAQAGIMLLNGYFQGDAAMLQQFNEIRKAKELNGIQMLLPFGYAFE